MYSIPYITGCKPIAACNYYNQNNNDKMSYHASCISKRGPFQILHKRHNCRLTHSCPILKAERLRIDLSFSCFDGGAAVELSQQYDSEWTRGEYWSYNDMNVVSIFI